MSTYKSDKNLEFMVHEKELDECVDLITVLCHPIRIKIACLIDQEGELRSHDIERALKLEQTTVSYHMRHFKKSGTVNIRQEGRWKYYSINNKKIKGILKALKKKY